MYDEYYKLNTRAYYYVYLAVRDLMIMRKIRATIRLRRY